MCVIHKLCFVCNEIDNLFTSVQSFCIYDSVYINNIVSLYMKCSTRPVMKHLESDQWSPFGGGATSVNVCMCAFFCDPHHGE